MSATREDHDRKGFSPIELQLLPGTCLMKKDDTRCLGRVVEARRAPNDQWLMEVETIEWLQFPGERVLLDRRSLLDGWWPLTGSERDNAILLFGESEIGWWERLRHGWTNKWFDQRREALREAGGRKVEKQLQDSKWEIRRLEREIAVDGRRDAPGETWGDEL